MTPGLQQFKYAAAWVHQTVQTAVSSPSSVTAESNAELKNSWQATLKTSRVSMAVVQVILLTSGKKKHRKQYSTFVCLAEDLLSAPASKAFVERNQSSQSVNFSLQGDETE